MASRKRSRIKRKEMTKAVITRRIILAMKVGVFRETVEDIFSTKVGSRWGI